MDAVDEVTGNDGELIERLIAVIHASANVDPGRVYNTGMFIVASIGGDDLERVVPTTPGDEELRPDSIGAQMRRDLTNVSMSEWTELIRRRVRELNATGVSESFLVEALRNVVTTMYEDGADVQRINEQSEAIRERLRALLKDQAALKAYQRQVAQAEPAFGELQIDQVADKIREFAESQLFSAVEVDQASERWTQLEAWRRDVDELLSDDVIGEWDLARARRLF